MMTTIPLKYIWPLVGLSASAFVFNTSEFMPIGLLTDISDSFSMTPGQTGIMITVYAWVVGLLSLPLMLATCQMNQKKLLLLTMSLFAIGQAVSGVSVNFPMLMGSRIIVACAHSIFWSIVAPLATRLVTRSHQPLALSVIATGSSVAMILGLPLGRVVGLTLGWRMTFLVLAGVSALALLFLWRVFPPLTNHSSFTTHDLPALVRNPLVFGAFVLSLLFALAYFTTYSYIEPFLGQIAGFAPESITWILMLLGACGLAGSVLFSRFYGQYRFQIFRVGLLGILAGLCLFYPASLATTAMLACCMFIGMISTLFNVTMQAELIRNCSLAAAPVAMSIFSGIFNGGSVGGTFIGGRLESYHMLAYIGFVGAAIALCAVLFGVWYYIPKAKQKEAM